MLTLQTLAFHTGDKDIKRILEEIPCLVYNLPKWCRKVLWHLWSIHVCEDGIEEVGNLSVCVIALPIDLYVNKKNVSKFSVIIKKHLMIRTLIFYLF